MPQRLPRFSGLFHSLASLFFLWVWASPSLAEEPLLLPDQAFAISAESVAPDRLRIRWRIADGYYLYKSKIRLASTTPGVALGTIQFPKPLIKQDDFFGEMPVYRGDLNLDVALQQDAQAPEHFTLEAFSQGCADRGICFPPHQQTVQVRLTAPPPGAAPGNLGVLTELFSTPKTAPATPVTPSWTDDFLAPEQAFQVDATVIEASRLEFRWHIAPGTYLYREKVTVEWLAGDNIGLGALELPPGEIKDQGVRPDGSIGPVEIYHQDFTATMRLQRSQMAATELKVHAKFQGCAERGICYPPMDEELTLRLPALSGPAPTSVAQATHAPVAAVTSSKSAPAAPPITEQDRIAATLATGNTGLVLLTFFGFGLLLSLTPCIFPMIPILSGIIAGHGHAISSRKAFVLSLVYVLAMAFTYTLAGVLAGLFGENLQAAFQNPWILGGFALIFALLALSMFGFYDLQLPSSWQTRLSMISNRQQGGSLLGVAVMGALSALIVGPCVAPPLAAALIYIGQTGDAWLGGMALFALSMGMGAPLIVLGTSAGRLLPRAGSWMNTVKAIFGVLFLAVAIIMLERVVPAAVAMLLWALLLIASGIYLGALEPIGDDASGWRKLWKGLGVALLMYGALMLIGTAAGGKDTVQPLRGLFAPGTTPGADNRHIAFSRIKTTADLDAELAQATAQKRPLLLDFYADWCVSCKEMERYTFSDPQVVQELSRFRTLQADVTANDAADKSLMQQRFGLPGPPAMLLFDSQGNERRELRVIGFMAAGDFVAQLRQMKP